MSAKRRVVITGFGAYTPIGNSRESMTAALKSDKSGICYMPDWESWPNLHTKVAGIVVGFDEKRIPREHRRSMARVAILAALATEDALACAKLSTDILKSGRAGIAIGQTVASPSATDIYFSTLRNEGVRALKSTTFLQMMSQSAAANIAAWLSCVGQVWAPASACASSAQAIGLGYNALLSGQQDVMLCGGAEEMHVTTAITFDIVQGTSRNFNDKPTMTPSPFDAARDGLVVSEGAGIVVLETLEHALARRATPLAEVTGFATTCDGQHISSPAATGMANCMKLALNDAKLEARQIDYVNAHATGTMTGDGIEAEATFQVLGNTPAVSSTKGHTGHTLAACGAIEAIISTLCINEQFVPKNLNLRTPDPAAEKLRLVRETQSAKIEHVLSNNFAFGGVNASLVLSRFHKA